MKFIYSFLLVLVCAGASFAQTASFRVPITVQCGTKTSTMHVGINPGNSIGLDTLTALGIFREEMLPPYPPTNEFSVRMRTIPNRPTSPIAGLGLGVMNDIRGYVDSMQVDTFRVEITGDSLEFSPSVITWGKDLSKYAAEWKIKPQTGADFAETNMLTAFTVSFPQGSTSRNALIIKKGARRVTGVANVKATIPSAYALMQNYPNPFNPETQIAYNLPAAGYVTLKVFDLLGQHVATLVDRTQQSGSFSVAFNGANFPSGIYFYRLQASGFTMVKRMMLIK